jgi:hypothetical protein
VSVVEAKKRGGRRRVLDEVHETNWQNVNVDADDPQD